jgi:SAM-dependent methyltransferase
MNRRLSGVSSCAPLIALGSGVGSRGVFTHLKRYLLNRYVAPHRPSVLDLGCGDLEVVSALEFSSYLGIDQSEEAIKLARARRPDWRFEVGPVESATLQPADVVLCLEVLIHIPRLDDLRTLVQRLGELTLRRILVTGYDYPVSRGEITFFHRPLGEMLRELGGFRAPTLVARYADLSVYVVDREGCDYPPPEPLTIVEYLALMISHESAEQAERHRLRHALQAGNAELRRGLQLGTEQLLKRQSDTETRLAHVLKMQTAVAEQLERQERNLSQLLAASERRFSRRVFRRLNRWLGRS